MDASELIVNIGAAILVAVAFFVGVSSYFYFNTYADESNESGITRKRMRTGYLICFDIMTAAVNICTVIYADEVDGEGLASLLLSLYMFVAALPLLIMCILLFVFNSYPMNSKQQSALCIIMGIMIFMNGYISVFHLIGLTMGEINWFSLLLLISEGIVEALTFITVFKEPTYIINK